MAWNDLLWFAMVRYGMECFIMVCHGMVLENPWDMLTNMLTVDTTTALGQVDMSLCIHTLFIYEAGNSPKVHLLLTDKLTVDTSKALGQVDMSFCIHTLFIYEASWEQSKGASFADRYADS